MYFTEPSYESFSNLYYTLISNKDTTNLLYAWHVSFKELRCANLLLVILAIADLRNFNPGITWQYKDAKVSTENAITSYVLVAKESCFPLVLHPGHYLLKNLYSKSTSSSIVMSRDVVNLVIDSQCLVHSLNCSIARLPLHASNRQTKKDLFHLLWYLVVVVIAEAHPTLQWLFFR